MSLLIPFPFWVAAILVEWERMEKEENRWIE